MRSKKEGKEEGFSEGKKETAKNMLKEKISVETIMKCTGLSKEEIETIK